MGVAVGGGVADGGGVAVADGTAGEVGDGRTGQQEQDTSGKVAGDEGLGREQGVVPCSVLVGERVAWQLVGEGTSHDGHQKVWTESHASCLCWLHTTAPHNN